jgi:hypothetical protein
VSGLANFSNITTGKVFDNSFLGDHQLLDVIVGVAELGH